MSEELRRQDDLMMGEIRQMLVDHINNQKEWNEKHDEKSKEWRLSIEYRIQELSDIHKGAKFFYKTIIVIGSLAIGSVKVYSYLKDHLK